MAIIAIGFAVTACNNGTTGDGDPTTCTLSYNGNGNTGGTIPTDSKLYQNGVVVTVLENTGRLVKTGNNFDGWNTAANGSGTPYSAGDTFTIGVNTILYAQWVPIPRTVTYNGNGNTSGEAPTDSNSPYQNGMTVTVLGNTGNFVKTDDSFIGWNTATNGRGTPYLAGDTFIINTDITLFAQWWREPTTVSPLSVNIWVEGSIDEETEQWYVFTAETTKNYIHLNNTGLAYAYVQVFTDLGIAIGSSQWLYTSQNAASSIYRELEVGQKYYVRVQQAYEGTSYKGAYRIALTETDASPNLIILPTEHVISLTANIWADGEVGSEKDQWYSFTANASTQYVHIFPGTAIACRFQVYGSNGGSLSTAVYSDGGVADPWELETGKTYYIRFIPSYYGTFKVAFNDSTTPPPITLPTEGVIQLTANTWTDGTTDGGEWYRFTANATIQYIYINFTTATGANIKVYDSRGIMLGTLNSAPVYTPSFSQELTSGSVYYLYVTRELYDGAFQITFNASATPPAITLPSEGITELMANTWIDGSTAHNGKQWFRFTANASPQYVHLSGISIGISLRLYDSNGNAIGNPIRNYGLNNFILSWSVTSGQLYYVKSEGIGYPENNYKISFNDSETPPVLE
jgi:hypothetical protein